MCECLCVCAYLAASVCSNACHSTGVSVWLALRLLAIMSSTVVVRGILVIASDPGAGSPRCRQEGDTANMAWASLLA